MTAERCNHPNSEQGKLYRTNGSGFEQINGMKKGVGLGGELLEIYRDFKNAECGTCLDSLQINQL